MQTRQVRQMTQIRHMRQLKQMAARAARLLPEVISAVGILAILGVGLWSWFFCSPCRGVTDCRGRDIDVEQMKVWEERARDGTSDILAMAGWRIERMETVMSVSTGRQATTSVLSVYGDAALVEPAKILAGDYALLDLKNGKWGNGKLEGSEAESKEADGRGNEDGKSAVQEADGGANEDGKPEGKEADGRANEGREPGSRRPGCILTRELSDALFGSTDTVGEGIRIRESIRTGAGSQTGKESRTEEEILIVRGVIDKEGKWLLRPVSEGSIESVAFRMRSRYQAEAKARQMMEME